MRLVPIIFGWVVLSVFGYGCSDQQSPDYEKIADRITANTAKKLEADKALHLVGTGGAMMHDIQMMMMGFQFYQVVDIEKARGLLVYSVEEYLSSINSNEEIRPYLHNYPFVAKNVKIVIYFSKPDHYDVPFGEVSIAAAGEGEIVYYTKSPDTLRLQEKHEETYQDALKAVSASQTTKMLGQSKT